MPLFCKKLLPFIIILICLAACHNPQYKNPHIEIETKYGNIEAEVYPDKAPKSVSAFLANVDAGLYKNTSFYRVLNDENQPSGTGGTALIQGGVWEMQDKRTENIKPIPHENTKQTGLLHEDGTLSLARQDTGTAKTEFFICVGDQTGFNYGGGNNSDGQGYAAFGKVVKGMDIVNRIHRQPSKGELFNPRIDIINIKRL